MPGTPTRLLNYFRAYGLWLFVRPRVAWKCALVVAIAVLVCIIFQTELAVRAVGMTLEVLGLFVAGWGLVKTRRDFEKPSLRALIKNWWGARPRTRSNIHHATAGAIAGGSSSVSGVGGTAISADASIEQQLTALIAKLERLCRDFGELKRNQEALSEKMRTWIAHQSEAHASLATELNTKLERTVADGLLVALVGLVWVLLGSILSTMSSEISCLLLTHYLPGPSSCVLAEITLGVRRNP
ncbi:MAG: hypothetical protein ACSLFJ_11860 [Immundisolibacter sp.]|uniref:hypothetical protein n=1 Tax=Immundisolibacter sp. TaxID=1934948 RepID=UPI003EE07795